MIAVVFPQLGPIFIESGVELPFFTKLLINSGTFLTEWWWAVVIVLGIIFILLLDYVRSEEGRAVVDETKIRLPIIKKVFLPVTLTRFSNAAGILLKGGVPLAQSMQIVSNTTENVVYKEIFREISENIRQGEPLSLAVSRYPNHIPLLVSQMLAVGESTGQLEAMFSRLSSFYGREADKMITNLVDLIQPILMVVVGVLVGLLFAAVLMPLYQLTSSFGGG
jgi:type II secretory pathway component PulF